MAGTIVVEEPVQWNPSRWRKLLSHASMGYLNRDVGHADVSFTTGHSSLLSDLQEESEADAMNKVAIRESQGAWNELEVSLRLRSHSAEELTEGFFKQYLVGGVFLPLMKEIQAAQRIIEHLEPDRVLVRSVGYSSFVGGAFEVVSERMGIHCQRIEPVPLTSFWDFIAMGKWHAFLANCLAEPTMFMNRQWRAGGYPRILFDVPYWNWFKAVEPVIDELSNRGSNCFVLCKGFSPAQLMPLKSDETKGGSDLLKPLVKSAAQVLNEYRWSSKHDREFQSRFAWNGIEYWKAVRDHLDYAFERLLPIVPAHNVRCLRICDSVNPDLLMIATMPRSYLLGNMPLICKQRGTTVLKVQHGVFDPLSEQFLEPLLFDEIACGGPYWVKRYEERGAPRVVLTVTGWPKYDEYAKIPGRIERSGKAVRRVLYVAQREFRATGMKAIGTIVKTAGDGKAILLIKPHPIEKRKDYVSIVGESEKIVVLEPRMNLRQCIEDSDIVITHVSTGGIDAVILGKRLFCLNLEHTRSAVIDLYVKSGVAREIRDLRELEESIKEDYTTEMDEEYARNRDTFIKEMIFSLDGKASRRVADLVIAMILRNEPWARGWPGEPVSSSTEL